MQHLRHRIWLDIYENELSWRAQLNLAAIFTFITDWIHEKDAPPVTGIDLYFLYDPADRFIDWDVELTTV